MYDVTEDLYDNSIIVVTFDYENISFTSEYKKELYNAIIISNMIRGIKREYPMLENCEFEIISKGTTFSKQDGRKYVFRLKKIGVG